MLLTGQQRMSRWLKRSFFTTPEGRRVTFNAAVTFFETGGPWHTRMFIFWRRKSRGRTGRSKKSSCRNRGFTETGETGALRERKEDAR